MSRFDIRINSIWTPQGRTRVTHCYPDQTPSGLTKRICASHLDQLYLDFPKREHVACIDIWIKLHPNSPRGHVTRFPYPDSFREKHTTLANITSGRPTYPIRICLSGSLTEVSKSCYIIPTACHSPRSAACRAKGQRGWQVTSDDPSPAERKDGNDGKSPPTISVSRPQGDDGPATNLESS